MTDRLDRLEAIVEANTIAIGNFQVGMSELREGQAMLVQMFVQEQESLREFKRVTNATLDRMERNQAESNRRQDAMQHQINGMQHQISGMQHQIDGVLEVLKRHFDIGNDA